MDTIAINTDQRSLRTGEMIEEYKIESVLGRGGFGITYLATDTRLGNKVAIKEYFPLTAWRDEQTRHVSSYQGERNGSFRIGLDRFQYEGKVLASFDHYNIVRILRLITAHNTAYLVMPYAEGETLETYLQRLGRGLTYEEVKEIFIPIMDGLKAVHDINLLHLDIAPDNIFLRSNGSPFLIDFGGARHQMGLSSIRASFLIAKDSYAPPEQYSGTNLQSQTDIYALAVCIYQAITKILPPSSQKRSQAMIDQTPDPLIPVREKVKKNKFPDTFLTELEKALQLNMTQRPASVKNFQYHLFQDVLEKPKKDATISKWVISGTIIIFTLLIIAIVYMIFGKKKETPTIIETEESPVEKIVPIESQPAEKKDEPILIPSPSENKNDPECNLGLKEC